MTLVTCPPSTSWILRTRTSPTRPTPLLTRPPPTPRPSDAESSSEVRGANLRDIEHANDPARKRATLADLAGLPDNIVGEIVDGAIHTSPRPAVRHARASSVLGGELHGPFDRGRGGPGGWILLDEPELHLGGDVLVPDLAGWRRERFPELPDAAAIEIAPDWVCEVLSPSTERFDRVRKLHAYAREHVKFVWLMNPALQMLEVYALDAGSRLAIADGFERDAKARAVPFEAIELDLALLW